MVSIKRAGRDATLIAWGRTVGDCLAVAESWGERGVDVDPGCERIRRLAQAELADHVVENRSGLGHGRIGRRQELGDLQLPEVGIDG